MIHCTVNEQTKPVVHHPTMENLGYRWRGSNGFDGRCYFTWDDPATGERIAHLHVYEASDPAVVWHLAFRDRLLDHTMSAEAYEREKQRCAALFPDDSAKYTACKKGLD